MMTFWQWLKKQKRRDDPVGDLARDAIADKVRQRSSLQWWKRHLQSTGACPGAWRALDSAWREYKGER